MGAADFTYNAADELTRIVDSRLSDTNPFRWTFGYGRDALGQVSSTTDQLPGLRKSYGYNALNQLTSETTSNRAQTTWSYDGAGNITGMQDSGSNVTESFGYAAGDNQLTILQATGRNPFSETYSYNADGDQTGMSGTQFAPYCYKWCVRPTDVLRIVPLVQKRPLHLPTDSGYGLYVNYSLVPPIDQRRACPERAGCPRQDEPFSYFVSASDEVTRPPESRRSHRE